LAPVTSNLLVSICTAFPSLADGGFTG
jgi:hypothetical protein